MELQVSLTFSQFANQCSVIICRFLLSLTDEHHFRHVLANLIEQTDASIHLAFKETEQGILYVLNSALHWLENLQKDGTMAIETTQFLAELTRFQLTRWVND